MTKHRDLKTEALSHNQHEKVLQSLHDLPISDFKVEKYDRELPEEHDVDLDALEALQTGFLTEVAQHKTDTD
jgi:hypothetical protein